MRHQCWIKEGLRFAATVIGAALLYSFFIGIMNGETTWEDTIFTGVIYLSVFGEIMTLIFNISVHQMLLPLTISLGCTRREAWAGLQIYRLTVLIPIVIVTVICTALAKSVFETSPYIIIALEIAAYLFYSSIGGLVGTLSAKLSKVMLRILSSIIILIGCSVAGVVVFFVMLATELQGALVWSVLGLAVLIYSLCSIAEVKAIKRLCVR